LPTPSHRACRPSLPLLPRLANAIFLRREFYDAVANDPRATGPAGAIVCIAAMARESVGLYEVSQSYKAWGLLLLLVVVFALLRWVLYATVMYPIARLIGGRAIPYTRLLRCLGFAETPAVLSLAAFMVPERFVPWVQFAVGAWLLAATIVAVRATTQVSTARAAVIGVIGFAAYLGLGAAVDAVTRVPGSPDSGALTLR
jgi:hypothetical protein